MWKGGPPPFCAGGINQDQPQTWSNCRERGGAAHKRAWQESLDDVVLQLITFLLVDLPALRSLDFLDLLFDRIVYHAAGKDAFFLLRRYQEKALTRVHERRIRPFSQRGGKAVGSEFLILTGASRLAFQCLFENLRGELQVLGKGVRKQMLKPHGVASLSGEAARVTMALISSTQPTWLEFSSVPPRSHRQAKFWPRRVSLLQGRGADRLFLINASGPNEVG